MILFQTQIEEHRKLADHYRELAAKREALAAGLLAVQQQADSDLSSLKLLLSKCKEVAPSAMASLKTAVLGLFTDDDGGNNDGAHQPNDPTPDSDPNPECDPEVDDFDIIALNGETGDCLTTDDLEDIPGTTNLTYAQMIKRRCSVCWGYQVESKGDIKSGFVNRANLNFMQAVNLERTGKEFYQTVEAYLDRLYYNGQTCEWASPLASPLCSLVWEDAPLLGQACEWASAFACVVEFPQPEPEKTDYTEFVELSASVGYLKVQHSGEIKAAYAGFTQKQRAESWGKWLAVRHEVASGFEVRLAKHLPFKWELKLWGLNINQINRLAKEDLTSSPHTEVDSAKPPSYKKPQHSQPVNPDEVAPGDIVTPLLTPGDSYRIIQIMPNGILDCKSLRTGVNMGMRPSAVSLLQKAEKTEHSPTAPSTEIQFNDLVEVVADANDTVGLVGAFGRVKTIKGSRIGIEIDERLTYFDSKELKVKASAEAAPQTTGLQSGQLLMGNRIVTTGNYTGLARRSSILNTRMGTADKVAALELVKGGLSPELALVTATGTADTDYDF